MCDVNLCACVRWAGQQHEGHIRPPLPYPERLYLWQSGIPHSRAARLSHQHRPCLHLPRGPQLPLWGLQDWQRWMRTQGQREWSSVYQTSQTSLPVSRPEQLHDPVLILLLLVLSACCPCFFFFSPLRLPCGNCMIHECFGSRHTSSFSLWWLHWCLSRLYYLLYQPVLLCLCCPTQVILLGIFSSVIINPPVHSCVCDLSCLLWKGYSEFN